MQVLIWEKNPLQRQSLQHIFEQEHHQVTLCHNYHELRHALKKHQQTPLVVVVYAHTLSHLKQLYTLHRFAPYASLLVLCLQQDSQTHLSLLNAGADAFLAQPFSEDMLLAQSRALQRQSKRLLQARLESQRTVETYHDFTFDFGQYTLYDGTEKVELSKREFLLLHYLLKHPHRVHRREKLYAIVWPGKTSAQGRQIDNLIVSLRQKITPQRVQFLSHYGKGYEAQTLSQNHQKT